MHKTSVEYDELGGESSTSQLMFANALKNTIINKHVSAIDL